MADAKIPELHPARKRIMYVMGRPGSGITTLMAALSKATVSNEIEFVEAKSYSVYMDGLRPGYDQLVLVHRRLSRFQFDEIDVYDKELAECRRPSTLGSTFWVNVDRDKDVEEQPVFVFAQYINAKSGVGVQEAADFMGKIHKPRPPTG